MRRVYANIREIVHWVKLLVEHVIVVPLRPRVHPRDTTCPFGRKYPGSETYWEDRLALNKMLLELIDLDVRISPAFNVRISDLYDCVHMGPAANKRLLNTIRKALRLVQQ